MSIDWDAETYFSGESLSAEEAEAIAGRPDGAFLLLDACREGRVDPDTADDAIERVRSAAIWQQGRGGRLVLAMGTFGAVAALVGGLSKSVPVIAAAIIVAGAAWVAAAVEKMQWL